MNTLQKHSLDIILVNPRGFCAGVTRAIEIVEKTLEKYEAPVYVVHEIVHNKHVVEELRNKGAVFVEELKDCPPNHPVIFSAHGVPKSVINEAEEIGLNYIEATCPLVKKVHTEVQNNVKKGIKTILIGHKKHAEVIGTKGQAPEGEIFVVSNIEDINNLPIDTKETIGYVTQTTLSADETKGTISYLQKKFPNIAGKTKGNVCYATTNRQEAVKVLAKKCDAILVIGDLNSSNSKRLVEVAKTAGCEQAFLLQGVEELELSFFHKISSVGITAGASAPESLVQEIVSELEQHFNTTVSELTVSEENLKFKLPEKLIARTK